MNQLTQADRDKALQIALEIKGFKSGVVEFSSMNRKHVRDLTDDEKEFLFAMALHTAPYTRRPTPEEKDLLQKCLERASVA